MREGLSQVVGEPAGGSLGLRVGVVFLGRRGYKGVRRGCWVRGECRGGIRKAGCWN